MPCPGVGPCSVYDLDLSCCLTPSGTVPDPCLLGGVPVDQTIIDTAKLAASQLLWAMTGRQFGCCTVTIRPCRKCTDECCLGGWGWDYSGGGFPWVPFMLEDGSWTNISCNCQDACSCTKLCEVNLPTPVCSVSQVKVDGVIVDPATYRVDNFKKLVRVGPACWPKCNNLTLPDTEVGTWSVTLTYGTPPPQLVLLGAAAMACEIIKSCTGNDCALPKRLTSITRQGMTASFLDDMAFLKDGMTGIYFVDLAARTYNPRKLARRPLVASPDSINQWRVSTWSNGDPVTGCS